jgi:dipeptidyl aminopeptidase/acylaminoacyl peptidase
MTSIWQSPPNPINQILAAPPTPSASLSPHSDWLLEMERPTLCPIAELAEPEVAIAGFRINPITATPARNNPYRRLWLTEVATGNRRPIPLPPLARLRHLQWSPDGKMLAFAISAPPGITEATGLELWVMELAVGKPWRVTGAILNGTYGTPYRWQSNEAFLCKVIPIDRGTVPLAPPVPLHPMIQENLGRKTPSPTFTNLLQNPHDEALFEYYITSTLEKITLAGERTSLVPASLISEAISSPDRSYILLKTIHHPFSYQVPSARFPKQTQVLDTQGNLVCTVADSPLDDQRSIKFDAVRPGRRAVSWRSDRPSTLCWLEALDGGDPALTVDHRDALFCLDAPFTAEPQELWRSQYRFRRIRWGREDAALTWEQEYDSRQSRLWRIFPSQPETPPTLLRDRSTEDRYSDPGMPFLTAGNYDRYILRFTPDGQSIYMSGQGASPQGLHPFVDRLDLATGKTQRLWQCQDPYFESIVEFFDAEVKDIITRRQSKTEPANYFRTRGDELTYPLTHYTDPAPEFAGVQKEVVRYQRADGVKLSAKLYLPAGYDPEQNGRLPMIFWVYPQSLRMWN